MGNNAGKVPGAPWLDQRREEEERRRIEEEQAATDIISKLPEELKIYILHFFTPKRLLQLDLPRATLRAVMQARERPGVGEIVRSTWSHRLVLGVDWWENQTALATLAEEAGLMPRCLDA